MEASKYVGIIKQLRKGIKYETVEKNEDFLLKKKFRYVDPEYKGHKLSEYDKKFRELLKQEKKQMKKELK